MFMDKNEIILYETVDHAVKLNVNIVLLSLSSELWKNTTTPSAIKTNILSAQRQQHIQVAGAVFV